MKEHVFWFRFGLTAGAGSLVSFILAPVMPASWNLLAYGLLLLVPLSMIASGAALFAGWRPKLPRPNLKPAQAQKPVAAKPNAYEQRIEWYRSMPV